MSSGAAGHCRTVALLFWGACAVKAECQALCLHDLLVTGDSMSGDL